LASIFVSYTSRDRDWAFWIGQELDGLGHTPRIFEWEVSGGGDVVAWMEQALDEADHVLCVVSKAYLKAPYSSWERRAAQLAAAKDRPGFMLPVFVEDCSAPLLFGLINRCDLFRVGEDEARVRLVKFLEPAAKPAEPQPFPGSAPDKTGEATAGPTSRPAERQPFPGDQQAEAAKSVVQYAPMLAAAQGFFGSLVGQIFLSTGLLVVYFAAVISLYLAKAPLQAFRDDLGPFLFWGIVATPFVCILLFQVLPTALRALREKRLREIAISGVPQPGYFRLQPYAASDHDAFKRLDGADREVLNWLRSTKSSLLYLSGASGVGKSSLLSASVLPELRGVGWTVIETRIFGDPVERLRTALLDAKGLFKRKPTDRLSLTELLRSAAETTARAHAAPLLLVIDQFEEFLILHDEAGRTAFASLLSDLAKNPIEGLKMLLVFRSDYRALVFKLGLPPLSSAENWFEISPYNRSEAATLLQGGGRELSRGALDGLFRGLDRIEDASGLYKPITLNMIGLVLETMGGTLRGDASKLIQTYLTNSLTASTSRDFVKPVLAEMITDAGTKEPHTEAELVGRTRFEPWRVKATLADLAQRGLVRRLEGAEATWEIAHDFLARMIGQLIGRFKPPLLRRAQPLIAPVVLLGWVLMSVVAMPYWRISQQQATEKALRERFGAQIGPAIAEVPPGVTSPINFFSISLELPYLGDDSRFAIARDLIRELTELMWLKLGGTVCQITNLEPLEGLTNLSALEVRNCEHITSLEPLKGLPKLRWFNLSGPTGITSLEPLKGLTNLLRLDLVSTTGITSLEPLWGLTGLQRLDLTGATGITNLEPLKGLTGLQRLDLTGATGITNLEPLRGLTGLQSVSLTGATGITSLEPLRGLTSLEKLDLTSATGITSLEPLRGMKVDIRGASDELLATMK
jgi:hypothetical protein